MSRFWGNARKEVEFSILRSAIASTLRALKNVEEMFKKCSTDQRFILKEITS